MQTNLSGRLSLCARYVREGSRLADIGTDHAYLPIALCEAGRIPSALACDINPLPLRSAAANIARRGLSDRIQTRLGSGLEPVGADEVDDIVIAGMGGELIAGILAGCAWIADPSKRLILQPMTRHEALIRRLCESGFGITDQDAVIDAGKSYTVLCVHYDGEARPCDDCTAVVGALRPDSEAKIAFLQKCLRRLKKQSVGDPTLLPTVKRIEELLA